MALRLISRFDCIQLSSLRASVPGRIMIPTANALLLQRDVDRLSVSKVDAALLVRYVHTSRVHLDEQNTRQELAKTQPKGEITTAKKVAEAGKDFTYLGFTVIGVGIMGVLFYTVGHELLSTQTPQGVFSTSLKRIKKNGEVCDELGDPIKGHGERTRRGYSRHISNITFEKDGVDHMRMQFYLKGSIRNGTAHAEVKKNESGKWEYRYLFVESDSYPHKTIVIEDNR